MKILGCEIDREIRVDVILETLPETFDTEKINYSFEWLTYSLTGPMMGFLLRGFVQRVHEQSQRGDPCYEQGLEFEDQGVCKDF